MTPSTRTPLWTEVKWCLGLLVLSAAVSVAGFAVFLSRLFDL